MYFSKEQRYILKLIRKGKLNSLTQFYKKVLLSKRLFHKPLIEESTAESNILFYFDNKEITINVNDPIFITSTKEGINSNILQNNINKISLHVKEFADLINYLEKERLIFLYNVKEVEKEKDINQNEIIFLCQDRKYIMKEILVFMKDIYDKKIFPSSRIKYFRGYTIDESMYRFEMIIKIFGLVIPLILIIVNLFLKVFKPEINNYIRSLFKVKQ